LGVTGNFRTGTLNQMKSRNKKILLFVLVTLLGLFGFYKFMTYDRNYTWSKEINEEAKNISKVYGLSVAKTNRVNVDEIKLPAERALKIKIQKSLNKVGLMNYGQEFGETILLTNTNTEELINFKSWCLGDHVIGIEIEYSNIEQNSFANLKQEFENHFNNYKIVWTELTVK